MTRDLVIGLDSSTTATKAIAWDQTGRAHGEGRAQIALSNPQAGWFEQEAEDWWISAQAAIKSLLGKVDARRIAAIAISNQRESFAQFDKDGKALRPGTLWLDERGRSEIERLVKIIGGSEIHRISGKPVDLTPCLYRCAWFGTHMPEIWRKTAKTAEVHGVLVNKLTGEWITSTASADPMGLIDMEAQDWSDTLLKAVGLTRAQLPAVVRSGTRVGTVHAIAAAQTGLMENTPVIAGGGDGQCAGLGANAVRDGVVYLNLGTAIIAGMWSPDPVVGPFWRTMTSPTGDGYFLEAVQRAGAYFVNWFVDMFAGGRSDPSIFERLEREAAAVPIGSDGLLAGTTLVGCMDPHWDMSARASFIGMHPSHTLGHFYRAGLEAITLQTARALEEMRRQGLSPRRIVAIGGGANSPLWTTMIADSTGIPIQKGQSAEASSLGAAISAAVGIGWFDSFEKAADAMTSVAEMIAPNPAARAAWAALSDRQAKVFAATRFAWQSQPPTL
jgi:xylulokinase